MDVAKSGKRWCGVLTRASLIDPRGPIWSYSAWNQPKKTFFRKSGFSSRPQMCNGYTYRQKNVKIGHIFGSPERTRHPPATKSWGIEEDTLTRRNPAPQRNLMVWSIRGSTLALILTLFLEVRWLK